MRRRRGFIYWESFLCTFMAGKRGPTAKSVNDYLAALPAKQRRALASLRRTIKSAAPGATEGISYQIPTYKHQGLLVSFAAFEHHLSFFGANADVRRRFAKELEDFEQTTGTIHFTPERPLPAALVKRIVRARVAENEARAERKKKA